ncbi:hypothetical protein S83_048700, partial [Arachis hypogaea]
SAQFKPGSLEQDTDDSRIASPAAKSKVSAFSFIVSPPSRALNPPLLTGTSSSNTKSTGGSRSVTNFNYRMNYSQWNLIVQHPNFDNVTQVFNFNYKPLTPYEGLTVQDGGEVRRWQRTVLLYFQIRGSKVPRLDSKIPNFLNLPFGGLVYTISFCIFQMVKEGVCCSQEVRAVERRLAMIESNPDGKTLLKLAYGSKLFAKILISCDGIRSPIAKMDGIS